MAIFEKWLPIEGFEGWYEVSNLGNVRRVRRLLSTGAVLKERLLSQFISKVGYYRVVMTSPIDGKQRKYTVHRLVAKAFVDGYAEGLVVNHIDENKTNNVASNLEWCSRKDNTNYGTALKRRGEKRRKPVYQCSLEGEIIARFGSINEAATALGIDHRLISACLVGKSKSSNGYKWAYSPKIVTAFHKEEEFDQLVTEPFESLEGEIWRTVSIDGDLFPNYEVSNKGRIRTIPRKGYSRYYKLCHPYLLRGRAQMTLKKNGRKFKTMVSRIVAFAFCEGYQSGYQANHIDENPLNDCAENLEWISCKENINYGSRTQKVINKRSKKVAQIDDYGTIIKVFPSIQEASKLVGGRIKKVCDGKQLKAKGYKWKYID